MVNGSREYEDAFGGGYLFWGLEEWLLRDDRSFLLRGVGGVNNQTQNNEFKQSKKTQEAILGTLA